MTHSRSWIYKNLRDYVKQGGHLLMTAAHLNTSAKRDGEWEPVHDGNISDLFGCRLEQEFLSKSGMKFSRTGEVEGLCYHAPVDFMVDGCDPFFVTGYARYAKTTLDGGRVSAILDDSFHDRCLTLQL